MVQDQSIKVIVDENNPSIMRDESKCINCGECARVCSQIVSVNNNYCFKTAKTPVCVNCGQCIKACPTNSMCVKNNFEQLETEIKNGKIAIISVAPAVRVSLGDEFGFKRGSNVEGQLISLLKKLGFKYVLDANFSADLTICEETAEFLERVKTNTNLPMFTSCCPSWVKFAETFYPELINNLSTCKSPISMQSTLVKTYFAKQKNLDVNNIITVSVTPCVAKKFEIKRPELKMTSFDSDYCITTTELACWAKSKKIDFKQLKTSKFDTPMGESSGGGVIFGTSGGVLEAAIRNICAMTNTNIQDVCLKRIRQNKQIKEIEINFFNKTLKFASVSGLANVRKIISNIKASKKYDFVEVMACQGGCVGGGGQPKFLGEESVVQKSRTSSLYMRDNQLNNCCASENPEIKKVYKIFLDKPNSVIAKKLLHTTYVNRNKDVQ